MDDPRWLRIVVVGLILAIFAVVYFLLTGGFSVSKSKNVQTQGNQANKAVVSPQPQKTATPSAYSQIANRTQATSRTLPNTGFPVGLAVLVSASAVISGLALRKFPK